MVELPAVPVAIACLFLAAALQFGALHYAYAAVINYSKLGMTRRALLWLIGTYFILAGATTCATYAGMLL